MTTAVRSGLVRSDSFTQTPRENGETRIVGDENPVTCERTRTIAPMVSTETVNAPGTVEPRFPGFNGLRAIAALAVVMTHLADSGGANAPHLLGVFFARMDGGVAIFFVLSGVLLYRPFARAHLLDGDRPVLVPYLWRRALRIYPRTGWP